MIRSVSACSLGLLLLASGVAQIPEANVNGIAVVVNDEVITRHDVMSYIAPSVELLVRQYGDQPDLLNQKLLEVEQDGLNQLIERKLIMHEFETSGYTWSESAVEDEMERRIRENFDGDRVALMHQLQDWGLTKDSWRKRLREEQIAGAMRRQHVARNILISPYKIEKYYAEHLKEFKLGDQVKLRSIMVSTRNKPNPDQVRRLMSELKQTLDAGAPFEELARIYSEETIARQGGDRVWVERDGLRKELADVAFELPPGRHSDVIDLDGTFWLLYVEAARKNHVRTLPEVRDEIEATLKAQEQNRLHQQWIDRLKKKSFVRYF